MTGSTAAAIVIPIVAFLLLIIWLSMVFHADRHPYWRGRQPMPQQRMTFLPNVAEVMAARPPASESAEPEPPTQPTASVPGQRQPTRADRPVATAGATATAARPRLREPRPPER